MPHEFLDYEKNSIEGLLLSADLLSKYKEEEAEVQERESKKSSRLREGNRKSKRAGKTMPRRTANLPKKRK